MVPESNCVMNHVFILGHIVEVEYDNVVLIEKVQAVFVRCDREC